MRPGGENRPRVKPGAIPFWDSVHAPVLFNDTHTANAFASARYPESTANPLAERRFCSLHDVVRQRLSV